MRKAFLTICSCLMAVTMTANVVNYTADDVSIFPNPERGFTEELGGDIMLSDSENHVVQPEADWYFDLTDPENAERRSQSLVMLMYYLGNYKTKDLSNKILTGFNEDMQILREHGFKCVLRFAYEESSKNDATLAWVKRHIQQLTPYLEANKDVIYVLEAGFVGRWGEWYYSEHFGNETQELNPDRRQVLEAMLAACPANRFLLARYAMIKTGYFGDTQALTAEQAFSGTDRARLGHHNDAFLNEWGNDGTYDDGDGNYDLMRQYIAQETLYVPNGGETNVEEQLLASIVAQYDTTMAELRRFHWSFCGSTYSEDVTDTWRTNGTFAEMDRVLGYRFQLISATLPDAAQAGEQAHIHIQLRNVGCAPLYNERPAYLVLSNQQSTFRIQLASDPRRWLPNGAQTTIDEMLTIPDTIPAGTYQLYLHLPDASPSIAADPRYAVRFANEGTWDAATGMNSLLSTVTVSVPSALEHTHAVVRPTKIIRDGQVLILRDGILYTLTGQEQRSY